MFRLLKRASGKGNVTPVVFIYVDSHFLPAGYVDSPGLDVGERLREVGLKSVPLLGGWVIPRGRSIKP